MKKWNGYRKFLDELALDDVLRLLQCIWDSNIALEEALYQQKKSDDMSF